MQRNCSPHELKALSWTLLLLWSIQHSATSSDGVESLAAERQQPPLDLAGAARSFTDGIPGQHRDTGTTGVDLHRLDLPGPSGRAGAGCSSSRTSLDLRTAHGSLGFSVGLVHGKNTSLALENSAMVIDPVSSFVGRRGAPATANSWACGFNSGC